ncbi:hypothetical protein F2Q69_00013036 [Brassica cretica]|uniref:Uncharacterized protein n=1 Tax=Brassica cretica TaxID=69181 RepID=A0A8S9R5C7_BRACR|nr:hypothetical protein F2Q69_00013036 [Brassica cretica]
MLHYADDPPGHAGLPSHHVQESKSQPCLAAQYRSMFGLKYQSSSDGRYRSMEVSSVDGGKRVSVDETGVWVNGG